MAKQCGQPDAGPAGDKRFLSLWAGISRRAVARVSHSRKPENSVAVFSGLLPNGKGSCLPNAREKNAIVKNK
jgi:hypothetical protein